MSQNFIDMLHLINQKDLSTQIVLQCAPVLTGIKISNLLIVDKCFVKQVHDLFENSNVLVWLFDQTDMKATFLLWKERELNDYLLSSKVQKLLDEFGYRGYSIHDIMKECAIRYTAYKRGNGYFPHEMGLLLGYPVKDVEGFVKNEGKNFLFTGYWKVYDDVLEAMHRFEQYEIAKEQLLMLLTQGRNVEYILSAYGLQTKQNRRIVQ